MKQSIYARTALASLLALCSFSVFANEFFDDSIKKQGSSVTSGKIEVMRTSNKKLKEKINRVCGSGFKRKVEVDLRTTEELNSDSDDVKNKNEVAELAHEEEVKVLNANNPNIAYPKIDSYTSHGARAEVKAINENVDGKGEMVVDNIVPVDGTSGINDTDQLGRSGISITLGGVFDIQGYSKLGAKSEDYRCYNTQTGKSANYYDVSAEQIKGANPLFPVGIGNLGDYSENVGAIANAIFHLKAENKNNDFSFIYGADAQFYVYPTTDDRGFLQDINSVRGRGAHVFLSSKYGDLKLGYQFGPEAMMRLDATRVATVDGAADSGWFKKVNLEGSAARFPFWVTPRLYTESFSSGSDRLSFRIVERRYSEGTIGTLLPFRIVYYSPTYFGVRFGIGYSPGYESSLFSVNDSLYANPFKEEINSIANALVDSSKFRFNTDNEIDGKKYESIDDAVSDLVNNLKFTGGTVTSAEKEAALVEVVGRILPAIDRATVSIPVEYSEKYRVTGTPTVIDDVILVPKDINEMKDGLISKVPTLINEGGNKDKFIKDLKEALNKFINSAGFSTEDIKSNIKDMFLDKVVNRILYEQGTSNSIIRHVGPDYKNIISAGASYEYDFSQRKIKLKTSLVGEYGKAKTPDVTRHDYKEFVEYNDLMGLNFGVSADYKINKDHGLRFAGSFAYLGKSGQPSVIKELRGVDYDKLSDTDERMKGLVDQFVGDSKNTMYWTAGAGYQYEDFYTSLTYFGSRMSDGDRLSDFAVGVQYDLSSSTYTTKTRFIPYSAIHYFITDEKQYDSYKITKHGSNEVPISNRGVLFLTGVKFVF